MNLTPEQAGSLTLVILGLIALVIIGMMIRKKPVLCPECESDDLEEVPSRGQRTLRAWTCLACNHGWTEPEPDWVREPTHPVVAGLTQTPPAFTLSGQVPRDRKH